MNSHELSQLYFVLCRKKECKVIIDKSEKNKQTTTHVYSPEKHHQTWKSPIYSPVQSQH